MVQAWEMSSPYAHMFINNPAYKKQEGSNQGDETARSGGDLGDFGDGLDGAGATDTEAPDGREDRKAGERPLSEGSCLSSGQAAGEGGDGNEASDGGEESADEDRDHSPPPPQSGMRRGITSLSTGAIAAAGEAAGEGSKPKRHVASSP